MPILLPKLLFLPWVVAIFCAAQWLHASPNPPARNPYIADSPWPMAHGDPGQSDYSGQAGLTGPSRALTEQEIKWVPLGPANAWEVQYSPKYPDGRRVIWSGGSDRVVKLDAETLEVLATFTTGQEKFYTEREIERYLAKADKLAGTGQPFYDHVMKTWIPLVYRVPSFYRLIDNNNEVYVLYSPIGTTERRQFLRVYGDAVATDPESDIVLKRQWEIPQSLVGEGFVNAINMTQDGNISIVTTNGIVMVVDRQFTEFHQLVLPAIEVLPEHRRPGLLSVRNGIANDDKGGIYVVTSSHMYRVQWTGEKLSLDSKDGGWSSAYPNEVGNGSGTTPTLMGWGAEEDRLVLIGDGARQVNLIAFWRDEIPADWEAIPGYSRRVAGTMPIKFTDDMDKLVQAEASPIVNGYGAFFGNMEPSKKVPNQNNYNRQLVAQMASYSQPGYAPRGGVKAQWNPEKRTFEQSWATNMSFPGVCTVSGASNLIYCIGRRDGASTLEGIDWDSGESVFHYVLGKGMRYNLFGGAVHVAPNGAIDCGCGGGLGMVRIQPRETKKR
ncbi:MAG: hypothetical protein HOC23_00500 [Halieaceae bacterium]|nr:hypothetical protein [Halieaceae bacterium]